MYGGGRSRGGGALRLLERVSGGGIYKSSVNLVERCGEKGVPTLARREFATTLEVDFCPLEAQQTVEPAEIGCAKIRGCQKKCVEKGGAYFPAQSCAQEATCDSRPRPGMYQQRLTL